MRIEQNRVQNSKNEEFFSMMPSVGGFLYIVFGNLKIEESRIDAFNPEKNQFVHFWSNLNSVLNPLML